MNTTEKAADLERRGYTVTVTHVSASVPTADVTRHLTQVQVRPRDGEGWMLVAEARCHPLDVFDPTIGAAIAIGRAYKALTPPLVWRAATNAPMSASATVSNVRLRGHPEDTP